MLKGLIVFYGVMLYTFKTKQNQTNEDNVCYCMDIVKEMVS